MKHVLAGGGCLVIAGLLGALSIHTTQVTPSAQPTATVTITACVYGPHGEADRRCTPGAVSGLVSQDNLGTTVCHKGWIATQRPSSTASIRDGQMIRYFGSQQPDVRNIREDHLISLELGGAPSDPRNLYPQRYTDSLVKDQEENELHTRVCARTLALAEAQQTLVEHWSR